MPVILPMDHRYYASVQHEFKEARGHLLGQFQQAEGQLATSEAERKKCLPESEASSTLLNSDNSPYGCDETLTTLGTKYWGFQLGKEQSLQDTVLHQLPVPLRVRCKKFLPWGNPEKVLESLADMGEGL